MKSIKKTPIIFGIISLIACFAYAKQEKVLQIFRNGEVIQEYAVDDIDYIEVNDLIPAPDDVNASVTNNQITIKWNPVDGATYNIYRSPDNVNFTLLASDLKETSYTDTNPLSGTNYYRVKAVIGEDESGYTTSVVATLTNLETGSGIYLGITGFNQALYDYPVLQLNDNSVSGFRNFIDGLTMKNGTLLYYSVDQALNAMQATKLPSDISAAAIVTFTDGLDQGSMMKDVPYNDDMEYLDALNNRIKNETVSGQPITAFSIGIRGKDVGDIAMFRANLSKLAYDPVNPGSDKNAYEVTSMSEVNAKFKEIAEKLSESNYIQTINLKMPGVSNGTLVRFTFDNVSSADKSELYIEGKFNLKERSLEEVKYVGLTSTSGTTIKGTVDDIFVNFKFESVHTENNTLIKSEFTDEWTYIASSSSWQINSEFDKTENSDIVTERSSAVIMLVLDCSSSLADDFVKAQTNAKDFINTLYQAVGGTEKPGEQEETIYSTTPKDLSVAIWKDGTRYYLTPEQYKKANLSNVTVEGLVVLSNLGNFIISPNNIQTTSVYGGYAKRHYGDLLPSKDQATVVSARYADINKTLNAVGWSEFDYSYTSYYLTNAMSGSYYYAIRLYNYTGGKLYDEATDGMIRGFKSLNEDGPISWSNENNLKLSIKRDRERLFINDKTDLIDGDEIEGLAIIIGTNKFILKLHNEQSGTVNGATAISLYNDILPTIYQAEIISMNYYDINVALSKFGGDKLSTSIHDYYLTKTQNGPYYYAIKLYNYTGGKLYSEATDGMIRGVLPLD